MGPRIRYIILESELREDIQKKLNQWLSTGYDVEVEHFISMGGPLYTAVIRRWRMIDNA